eukprot:sb/3468275/
MMKTVCKSNTCLEVVSRLQTDVTKTGTIERVRSTYRLYYMDLCFSILQARCANWILLATGKIFPANWILPASGKIFPANWMLAAPGRVTVECWNLVCSQGIRRRKRGALRMTWEATSKWRQRSQLVFGATKANLVLPRSTRSTIGRTQMWKAGQLQVRLRRIATGVIQELDVQFEINYDLGSVNRYLMQGTVRQAHLEVLVSKIRAVGTHGELSVVIKRFLVTKGCQGPRSVAVFTCAIYRGDHDVWPFLQNTCKSVRPRWELPG